MYLLCTGRRERSEDMVLLLIMQAIFSVYDSTCTAKHSRPQQSQHVVLLPLYACMFCGPVRHGVSILFHPAPHTPQARQYNAQF